LTEQNRKKKEPTFKKVEEGLVCTAGDVILVGLPTEVERKDSAEGGIMLPIGGKGKGQKYSRTKYKWIVVTGSPLPVKDLNRLENLITKQSGTIVTSLDNATIAPIECKKCGYLNLGNSKFCSNCGNPL
jgi:type II secretory pathway component HofQ